VHAGRKHDSILAVSHGSGTGADAIVVESDGVVPANTALEGGDDISYAEYLRQRGAPPEFDEQQANSGDYAAAIVVLDVDGGDERVSVPAMGTDADPSAFFVGDRVETTIRRIYTQEGVTRYGFRLRPS
jgi:hydroxymethylglutaryl-CoA synthase